jgi:hypothetical protein
MCAMPPSTVPGAGDPTVPVLSRRRLFAAAGAVAGSVALLAGCSFGEQPKPAVSPRQADQLAKQVAAQEALVAAFAAAAAATPALGTQVADLADQAKQQLDRLKAAAPGAATSSSAPASGSSAGASAASPGPPPGADVSGWLRQQVAATAASHAGACLDQVGARAALLGSIAAGLRGQDGRLA